MRPGEHRIEPQTVSAVRAYRRNNSDDTARLFPFYLSGGLGAFNW